MTSIILDTHLYTEKVIQILSEKSLAPRVFSSVKKHMISLGEKKNLILLRFLLYVRKKKLSVNEITDIINSNIVNRTKLGLVLDNISSFTSLPLGPGELMCLMAFNDVISGGQRKPDLIFINKKQMMEVKSFQGKFRTTESTSFFTDLGAIIQALVQGGFLHSLTEIRPNELTGALENFKECLISPRGFIQWKGETWELQEDSANSISFIKRPRRFKKYGQYSSVRNSLRNWLGRGVLSIELGRIIDPERKEKISYEEIDRYISNLIGSNDSVPISLDQYYHLCGLSGIIIYERDSDTPYKIYSLQDLSEFRVSRISQGKVEYVRKKLA